MNKIIVAPDSLRAPKSAVSCAMDLCKNMDSHLVVVFPDDFSNSSYKSAPVLRNQLTISQETYDVCIRKISS